MAKRKNKSINNLVSFISLALAVVAVIMLCLDCAKVQMAGYDLTAYKGFDLIFGKKEEFLGKPIEIFGFNFLGLLALILLVVGAVLPLLKIFGKLGRFISFVALIAAAVLFFIMKSTVVGDLKETLVILAPVYIAGGCSAVAGLLTGYTLIA